MKPRTGTSTTRVYYIVLCAECGYDLPNGGTHIVLSDYGPERHALYCPTCCPCQRRPEVIR